MKKCTLVLLEEFISMFWKEYLWEECLVFSGIKLVIVEFPFPRKFLFPPFSVLNFIPGRFILLHVNLIINLVLNN